VVAVAVDLPQTTKQHQVALAVAVADMVGQIQVEQELQDKVIVVVMLGMVAQHILAVVAEVLVLLVAMYLIAVLDHQQVELVQHTHSTMERVITGVVAEVAEVDIVGLLVVLAD
jgi:hypothetical protein